MAKWWEKWEGRLDKELQALSDAGMAPEVDEAAKKLGFIRVSLTMEADGSRIDLVAVFPQHYPYFRVQVSAPGLELSHHQNPFQKNLCLLGRRTHFWNPSQTLASLLLEQLPKLLNAATSDVPPEEGLEAKQGEPVSEYFPYHPGAMVIVQSGWVIPPEHLHGTLSIATEGSPNSPISGLLRGVVSEVRDPNGKIIVSADPRLLKPYSGQVVKAGWVRAGRMDASCEQNVVYQSLLDLLPVPSRIVLPNTSTHGCLRIIGALFAEETSYRRTSDGWIFACRLSPNAVEKRGSTGGRGLTKHRNKRR